MNKKAALLIIDGQIDFMDLPGSALPVTGACADMDRVIAFIKKNVAEIDNITCTLDSHRTLDISHPSWWMKKDGSPVDPFTPISSAQVKDGTYTPKIEPKWSREYVESLETQGEFGHFIWPYHCLIGSAGTALYPSLHKAINEWEAAKVRPVNFVTKGDNPYTEHFGAFRANIEIPSDPKTHFNQGLIKTLMDYEVVYLAGEAKSHCVANSLRQLVNEAPTLIPKLVILQDCMSNVAGLPREFYDEVNLIYDNAKKAGVRFAKSTDNVMATV